MRVALVADMRSPIARQWAAGLEAIGIDYLPISTSAEAAAKSSPAQTRLSSRPRGQISEQAPLESTPTRGKLMSHRRLANVVYTAQAGLARLRGPDLREVLMRDQVDLVHALRIPFEGILAAYGSPPEVPLALSVWGNDLTLRARSNALVGRGTRRALGRAAGLHCDNIRDVNLAWEWGLRRGSVTMVWPGTGGVDRSIFHSGGPTLHTDLGISTQSRILVNPRGLREYVETATFFRAVRLLVAQWPDLIALCPGMPRTPPILRQLRSLRLVDHIRLLPQLEPHEMAAVFRTSEVVVSLSTHDGTPNSLLEGMAVGCLPVVGAVDSVLEWITDGYNGLVVNPKNEYEVAAAMNRALRDSALRSRAYDANQQLIASRADRERFAVKVTRFYTDVISHADRHSHSRVQRQVQQGSG